MGALLGFADSSAGAQAPATNGRWQPVGDARDSWFDVAGSKRRIFFDTTSPAGVPDAAQFAGGFFSGSKSGYGLGDEDLAIIIGFRHNATCFGYNDAMWAKYGAALGEAAGGFKDPKTGEAAAANVRRASLEGLAKRGVRFTICELSTRRFSGAAARATSQKTDDVFKEISANLILNARLVPAGIVALDRAHEHGYTITTVIG